MTDVRKGYQGGEVHGDIVRPVVSDPRGGTVVPLPRASYAPLTPDQLASIAERVREVMEATGYGEVRIVIERGRVHAFRTVTEQLFLDSLLASGDAKSHGRGVNKRGEAAM